MMVQSHFSAVSYTFTYSAVARVCLGRGATHRADVCIPFPCARGDSTRASNVRTYGRRNMGCFSGMFPQSLFHQTPSRFVVVNALPPLRGWLLSNGRRRRAGPVVAAAAASPPSPSPACNVAAAVCGRRPFSVRPSPRETSHPPKAGQAKSRSIAAGEGRRGSAVRTPHEEIPIIVRPFFSTSTSSCLPGRAKRRRRSPNNLSESCSVLRIGIPLSPSILLRLHCSSLSPAQPPEPGKNR